MFCTALELWPAVFITDASPLSVTVCVEEPLPTVTLPKLEARFWLAKEFSPWAVLMMVESVAFIVWLDVPPMVTSPTLLVRF